MLYVSIEYNLIYSVGHIPIIAFCFDFLPSFSAPHVSSVVSLPPKALATYFYTYHHPCYRGFSHYNPLHAFSLPAILMFVSGLLHVLSAFRVGAFSEQERVTRLNSTESVITFERWRS